MTFPIGSHVRRKSEPDSVPMRVMSCDLLTVVHRPGRGVEAVATCDLVAANHERETQARAVLSASAAKTVRANREALREGRHLDWVSAQGWQDWHAPQWALDTLTQKTVGHLMAYYWGES